MLIIVGAEKPKKHRQLASKEVFQNAKVETLKKSTQKAAHPIIPLAQ
jgi:hypothetical protein